MGGWDVTREPAPSWSLFSPLRDMNYSWRVYLLHPDDPPADQQVSGSIIIQYYTFILARSLHAESYLLWHNRNKNDWLFYFIFHVEVTVFSNSKYSLEVAGIRRNSSSCRWCISVAFGIKPDASGQHISKQVGTCLLIFWSRKFLNDPLEEKIALWKWLHCRWHPVARKALE